MKRFILLLALALATTVFSRVTYSKDTFGNTVKRDQYGNTISTYSKEAFGNTVLRDEYSNAEATYSIQYKEMNMVIRK